MTRSGTRRAGVIGWPVAHSLSPIIHETWAAREGLSASYERLPVEPDFGAFSATIGQLRAEGYRGVNVTIPHKEHALKAAGSATGAAKRIGAANMLTFDGGSVKADNSDAEGFAAAFKTAAGSAEGARALILGAGGSARAVHYALIELLGAARVVVANRTEARARAICGDVAPWSDRHDAASASDIIVNTTSLGMTGEPQLDLDLGAVSASAVVVDIVYRPLETPLLKAARARGLKTVDGLEMLMRQAVPGYLAWLGTEAEVDADLRARLEAALKARNP